MGARLARYTGNTTYSDWAEKTWDWMWGVGLIDNENYAVYDGAHIETNCTDIFKAQFSYNNAVLAQGAAFLNSMNDGKGPWKQRLEALVDHGLKTFFVNNAATEIACETSNSCNTDMLTFKGFLHRWYANIAQLTPDLSDKIMPVLQKSAAMAIKQCTGGDNGRQCGLRWSTGKYDGKSGAGQEMSALGAVISLLAPKAKAPYTYKDGGTSKSDPNAGGKSDNIQKHFKPITTGDKAGAGILTFLVLGSACGMFGWMSVGM